MTSAGTAAPDLSGHAVVVTGAGSGLGRAYALDIAGCGARVIVNDIDDATAGETAALIGAAGGDARVHVGSVADWEVAGAVVGLCVAEFGAITGFINNAGILHAAHAWDEDEARLRGIVNVNLLGTMFCGAHVLKRFVAQRSGVLINVASSTQLGVNQLSAYGSTKAAIATLTYAWAKETEPYAVRVNAISPLARTPILDCWDANPEQVKARENYPEPEEVAPLASFLLSDAATEINGRVLRADGRTYSLVQPARYLVDCGIPADQHPTALAAGFAQLIEGMS